MAPDLAGEAEEDADLRTSTSNRNRISFEQAFFFDDINSTDDPRLRRLAESHTVDRDEIRADHRRIRQAEIVSTVEDAAVEEEDEDAVEEKRRSIRERLLKLRCEEERELLTVDEEDKDAVSSVEDEDDEEESEYETDSEEEEAICRVMAKPDYVLKQERETIAERERLEAKVRALDEAEAWKLGKRKRATKQIVVEMIREDYVIQKSLVENEADVGDMDTDDEAEEYENWKAREIARIKRDGVDRDPKIKEKEEIEKVRNMTEEERKNPKSGPSSAPKKQWKFLQTYHHKGAYFQSDPDDRGGTMGSYAIYWWDFSAPTGDDKLNKSILPKVMQD